MALLTVEGIFRDGKVELTETPPNMESESRVLVTFLTGSASVAADNQSATQETREAAIGRMLKRMEEGLPLGGPPYPKREEIYDRHRR